MIVSNHLPEWLGILLFAVVCETISVNEPLHTHKHAKFRIMLLDWLPLKEALWYNLCIYTGWYTSHIAQKKGLIHAYGAPFLAGLIIILHDIPYECVNTRRYVEYVFINRNSVLTDMKDTFLEGSTAIMASFMMVSTLACAIIDYGLRRNHHVVRRILQVGFLFPLLFIAFMPYNIFIKYFGCMDYLFENGINEFEGGNIAMKILNGLFVCSSRLSVFSDSVGCVFLGTVYFAIILEAVGKPGPLAEKDGKSVVDPYPSLIIIPVILTMLIFVYLLIFVYGIQSNKVINRDKHLFSTAIGFILMMIQTLLIRFKVHYYSSTLQPVVIIKSTKKD